MEAILTLTHPIHVHKIELFLQDVFLTVHEKNNFMKFFPNSKFTRPMLPPDQQIVIEIGKMVIDNRGLEGTFPIDLFDTTLLHFKVKLRQRQTTYVLALEWIKENSMFPTATIIRALQTRHIEIKPYIFAELDVQPMYDSTLLNTFLTSKSFNIQLQVPLTDIQFNCQNTTYTLRYRKNDMAGYVKMNTPHLDMAETQILDEARRRTRHRDYGQTTTSYDGPRNRLRNTFSYSDDISYAPRSDRHYRSQQPDISQYFQTSNDNGRDNSLPPQYSEEDPLPTLVPGQRRVDFQTPSSHQSREHEGMQDRNDL